MRPEKLSFCGINSFSKPAEIDFSALLSGGIFGIFGDTGSGKTTILDSMIFCPVRQGRPRQKRRDGHHQL